MNKYPEIQPFPFYTDIDPCNPSTILFECSHPALYVYLIEKMIIVTAYLWVMAKYLRTNDFKSQKIIRTIVGICSYAVLYTTFYYFFDSVTTYSTYKSPKTQIYKLKIIPLDFLFLCQANFLCEIAGLLVYMRISFALVLQILAIGFKYLCYGLILTTLVLICLPFTGAVEIFHKVLANIYAVNDYLYPVIYMLAIIILSFAFVFSPEFFRYINKRYTLYMKIALFIQCLGLALDFLTHRWGHSNLFISHLYYRNRHKYMYIDLILKFFYHDFPQIVLLMIVIIISLPDMSDTSSHSSTLNVDLF